MYQSSLLKSYWPIIYTVSCTISILVALDKQGHKAKRPSRCLVVYPSADVVSQWGQNNCNPTFKEGVLYQVFSS